MDCVHLHKEKVLRKEHALFVSLYFKSDAQAREFVIILMRSRQGDRSHSGHLSFNQILNVSLLIRDTSARKLICF